MTFVATKPSWADWVISICFVFVVSVVIFQSAFLPGLELSIVSLAMLVSRHIGLRQERHLFSIVSASLGVDPKTVSSVQIDVPPVEYLTKAATMLKASCLDDEVSAK